MNPTSSSRLTLACVGIAILAAACGGSSGIDLFSNADAGSGGPAGGNEAGTTSSSSGNSSGSASGGSDGGREGGTPEGGTRPGGDTTSIPCGAASCALATDVCCLTSTGGQGNQNAAFACQAGPTCPPPNGSPQNEDRSVTLKCTGAANCAPGTVCCVGRAEDAVVARCAATCNGEQAQLCDPNAATTGCSAAQPCSSENIRDWGLPRTFATCGGKGD